MESIGCEFWRYGPNCSLVCGHCHANTTCDVQGLCPTGCQYGWKGSHCVEADDPYPLSTLLLSGFLAVSLILLLFVSLELHKQIQSKKKLGTRLSSYEIPGQQLIKKESENRYGTLDRYHHIQDISKRVEDGQSGSDLKDVSDYEKAPEMTELDGIRDSSDYTVPNMACNQSDSKLCVGTSQGSLTIITEEQNNTSEKTLDRSEDNDHYITIIG